MWVSGCVANPHVLIYSNTCKETAPEVYMQLKSIKQLFVGKHMHKISSLRDVRLLTTLIKDSKVFFFQSAASLLSSSAGTKDLRDSQPYLMTSNWSFYFLYFRFLWFFVLPLFLLSFSGTKNLCLYSPLPEILTLSLFCLADIFTVLSHNFTVFSDIWTQVMCVVLEQDLGSLEKDTAELNRSAWGYKADAVVKKINTTGIKFPFWHRSLGLA